MTDREGNDFTKERAQPPESIALLVVDDDEAVLQVTRLVLSRYRYRGAPLEVLEAQRELGAQISHGCKARLVRCFKHHFPGLKHKNSYRKSILI